MSYKPLIKTFGDPKFYPNALVFATKIEAEQSAMDLFSRWTQAEEWKVKKVDDPANYSLVDGQLVAIEKEDA